MNGSSGCLHGVWEIPPSSPLSKNMSLDANECVNVHVCMCKAITCNFSKLLKIWAKTHHVKSSQLSFSQSRLPFTCIEHEYS